MIFSTARDNHLKRFAALTRKILLAHVSLTEFLRLFSAFVLLGEGATPTAEAAALSLPSTDGNFAAGTFDQLQKHGKIHCGKVGKKYSFFFCCFVKRCFQSGFC